MLSLPRSVRIVEDSDRRICLELPPGYLVTEPRGRLVGKVAFNVFVCLVGLAGFAWILRQAGVGPAMQMVIGVLGPLLVGGITAWHSLKLMARDEAPGQRFMMDGRKVIRRLGDGWKQLSSTLAIRDLRVVQVLPLVLEDDAPPPNATGSHMVMALDANFGAFLIANNLDEPTARAVAGVVVERANAFLRGGRRAGPPVRLAAGDDWDDMLEGESRRSPPGRRLWLDHGDDGPEVVYRPSVWTGYLSPWVALAIALAVVATASGSAVAFLGGGRVACTVALIATFLLIVVLMVLGKRGYAVSLLVRPHGLVVDFPGLLRRRSVTLPWAAVREIRVRSSDQKYAEVEVRHGRWARRRVMVGGTPAEAAWLCLFLGRQWELHKQGESGGDTGEGLD